MNQILFVQDKSNNRPIDTKKIVLFFAISIILFGIIFLGEGAYAIYQNKMNEKVSHNSPGNSNLYESQENKPSITLEQTEDNKIVIKIESPIAISHIVYNWNSEASTTIEESGKTTIEETVNIPIGENSFNLSVIDVNGVETREIKTFVLEASKPIIELSVIGDNIKITVTSEADLSYVTYKWNADEEKRENMNTYENKTKFEKTLEIPKGQNTLKITAEDVTGNQSEKSQEIKGVTRAKTSTIVRYGYIEFTVEADENIQSVEYTINGESYIMTTNTFGQTKVVHYKVKLIQGMNYLKIVSTTQSGAVDTTVWKYDYKQ